MNILFLTLLDFNSIEEHNIYTDLLREFQKHEHRLYVISPIERRKGKKTHLIKSEDVNILKLRIGNTQKTNLIEKGISTISIEPIFIRGIKKFFSDVKFDLILYSTPPITFCNAIKHVKKRDNAKTYLMLKDIFPQNAVDMGMLSKDGIKGIVYKLFRAKEKKLYAISDCIGCMSKANVEYILKHNPEIQINKVGVCPNCIEVQDFRLSAEEKRNMRNRYGIPNDKKVFVYGGNLGKPQGIPFIIECLKSQAQNQNVYFLIVGDGTEYCKLENYFNETKPVNMKLMKRLPREDYDRMIAACDVGLIFLDYRFTIPNFPSRLLSYMQAGLPTLACTDVNTDIGKIIQDAEVGWWCESKNYHDFDRKINEICMTNCELIGKKAYKFLMKFYNVSNVYNEIKRGTVHLLQWNEEL